MNLREGGFCLLAFILCSLWNVLPVNECLVDSLQVRGTVAGCPRYSGPIDLLCSISVGLGRLLTIGVWLSFMKAYKVKSLWIMLS